MQALRPWHLSGLGWGGRAENEALEDKIATEYSELLFGLYQVSKNTFQFVDLFSLRLKC